MDNNTYNLMKILNENKNISFIDRLQNPQNYGVMHQNKYIPKGGLLNFFENAPEAEINTHLMSAEFDEEGNAYVFPLIQKGENGLIQFSETREGKRNALNNAKKNNNAILFNSFEGKYNKENIKEADKFSRNYKTSKFKEYYDEIRPQFYRTPPTLLGLLQE